jgi:hypothetical protein
MHMYFQSTHGRSGGVVRWLYPIIHCLQKCMKRVYLDSTGGIIGISNYNGI